MMHHVHHALKASGSAMQDNHNVTPFLVHLNGIKPA
jgi:hypothetical protein